MAGDRFLVSARKYRPQKFSELVSQEHVADTLRNALRLERVAHAYLFCGPRGVGKTSAARILAKTMNCQTPREERPDMEPCQQCDSCRSFEEGRSLNVIEIDAASNNGVDDIRALREAVRIPPQAGSKKVYIIDEIHMLSKQAFNALLKTLEEPPSFIQFIFATTEPHKLLPTVLSRCQRFDFRRISVPAIVEHLQSICADEGIEADEASLRLIARKGDGAMRDALSTFDQAVILGGKRLVYDEIVAALGAVSIDTYFETTDIILKRDRAGILNLVEKLASTGTDFDEFLSGLTDHLRDLLIATATGETKLIEADQASMARYAEQARSFSEPDLLRQLIVVNEGQEAMKRAVKPRLRLELTLLKMASIEAAADLQSILRRLESINELTEVPGRSTAGNSPAPKRAPDRMATPSSESKAPIPVEPTPAAESTSAPRSEMPAAAPSPKVETVETPPAAADSTADNTAVEPADETTHETTHETAAPTPPAVGIESVAPAPGPPIRSLFGAPALQRARPKRRDPEDKGGGPVSSEPARPGAVEIASLETAWNDYVKDVAAQRIHVGALLQHTRPASIDGETVKIAVPDEFHERLLGKESDYLSQRLRAVMSVESGLSMRFFVSKEGAVQPPEEVEIDPLERVKKLRQENPIIRALFDEFGGELVW